MINWKFNENIEIELPELTLEAFDKFMQEPNIIPKDVIIQMRKKFKQDIEVSK